MTSQPFILVICGSLRTGSYNRKVADLAVERLRALGARVEDINLREYVLPIYDGDLEAEEGVPQAAQVLHRLFREAQGVLIVSPEYNAGPPPVLKNAIDWISRVREHGGMESAFARPVFALASASPGGYGGYRGLQTWRQSLVQQLGAVVIPPVAAVARAHEAFDDEGQLKDGRTAGQLNKVCERLVKEAGGVEPYAG